MKDWTKISNVDKDKIWDRFYNDFSFRPSVYKHDWPSIKTDKTILKFDIKNLWGDSYSDIIYTDFIQKAIDAFIEITNPDDSIIALDWQHECFYIDPRQLTPDIMTDDETSIPIISFIPDGDYYIFITKDFENIWFGHPWEKSITIIGDRLMKAFNNHRPLLLTNEK
jgi:hypothetical protein